MTTPANQPDLITWLRAQLDDDERAARAAAAVCGCHSPATRWLFDDESTDGRIVVADDPHPEPRRRIGRRWNRTHDGLFMAQHIARHDPARVLAEVDAKRRILDAYDTALTRRKQHPDDLASAGALLTMLHVVKLLALPYAEREGYREEWRPA